MVLISDNEVCEASKCESGTEGPSEQSSGASEDVWEIVDHLLKSYNQQVLCSHSFVPPPVSSSPHKVDHDNNYENKLKSQNHRASPQDFIVNSGRDEVLRNGLTSQNEPGKEKQIEELAQEFGQQTASTIHCPISEQLQVINEEDLAAILPDVETSVNGNFDELISLNNRNVDPTTTLIESLEASYDTVALLPQHEQISEEAEPQNSPSSPQNVESGAHSYSTPSNDADQGSSPLVGSTNLINPSIYGWLLKPSDTHNGYPSLSNENDFPEQKSPEATSSKRLLRSGSKRQTLESNTSNYDGEHSVKIDCSVSHVSLDSGFGGSPSYTSSPNSAYLYSPLSVENKSPTSTFRSGGTRMCHETNSFKRSQSPERNHENIDDSFRDLSQSSEAADERGDDYPLKARRSRSKKKSVPKKSDICSLVEKFISIEERSKRVVKKSPHRERIKKVRRWLKLERKKKLKEVAPVDSNISTDIEKLISKFNGFTIVEKNPYLTRASNHIIKSKFRCKCCAESYPEKKFSHAKATGRRRKKTSAGSRENASSEKNSTQVKKVKRNFDLRTEKCERRLPLKKRLYRMPSTSHSKTESPTDPAEIKHQTSLSISEVPEQKEGSSLRLSSKDRNSTQSVPVTPKKRFQMEHLSASEGEQDVSAPSKNDRQCRYISPTQPETNLEASTVKTLKISDDICKRMKSVSLVPSIDLNVCLNSVPKDLNKTLESRRSISSKIVTRASRVSVSQTDHQNKDLNKSKINRSVSTRSEVSSKGGSYTAASNGDCSDQFSATPVSKHTNFNREKYTVSESGDCAKNRKKRRRTFNRTGFPTKRRKKKHNGAPVTDMNAGSFSLTEKFEESDPHQPICENAITVSTSPNIVAENDVNSVEESSKRVFNGLSDTINSPVINKNSDVENSSRTEFVTKAVHRENVESDINASQNRRETLRDRSRHKYVYAVSAEAKENGCDKIARIRKLRRDHQRFMKRCESIISKKNYLNAGLFSNQFKVNNSKEINTRCFEEQTESCAFFPSPSYYAKLIRQQKVDFTLPYDIWVSHRKGKTCPEVETELSEENNIDCDPNVRSSSESSMIDLSAESAETSNDGFSPCLPAEVVALDCDSKISSQSTETLTDDELRYIRTNSCFLIRNLVKAQKLNPTKNSALRIPGTESNVDSNPCVTNGNSEKVLHATKNFQNLTISNFAAKRNFNFESNSCNASCSQSAADNLFSFYESSEKDSCNRKFFTVSDTNKSHLSLSSRSSSAESVHAENGQKYLKVLIAGNVRIQTGENVYVTKDISERESDEPVELPIFGRGDCDIFHIERLWRDENNDAYAHGHYYLRPHQTFHEPSRRFFRNELMKSPLSETVPVSRIVDHCYILDLKSYSKGRPAGISMEHVFICEYRVDKAAKTFSRIPKRKARFGPDVALILHQPPLKPVRNYKPYCSSSTSKIGKKQHDILKLAESEADVVLSTYIKTEESALIPFSTEISERSDQQQRLNGIICKLAEKIGIFC